MRDLRELLDPARTAEWCAAVRNLSADEAGAALVTLAALEKALSLRVTAPTTPARTDTQPPGDRLLTPEQMAEKFNRSVDWVYRQARKSEWRSFVVRPGRGTVRFSESGIQKWLHALNRLA